ncbi:MAG TPA: hypothetical protein VFS47_07300 [Steroidobacteraceae bacterium]|nr:hypothetical protein [Steroidobacteraceae bacterium]
MSFSAFVAMLTIVGAEPADVPLDQLLVRWESECKAPVGDAVADCVGLNADIELELHDMLRKMALNRQPIDRDVLRAAAQAHLPALARMGANMLGAPQDKQDVDALLAALDHPTLAVRYAAAHSLDQAKDPAWEALKPWWTGASLGSANAPEDALVPDPKPLPSQFEMMSFNGLTYHYYGSDKDKAMFTTNESVESFVARLGKKRKVLKSTDALQQQMDAIQPEMDAINKEMEEAGEANDMDRLNKAMQRMQELNVKMGNISTITSNAFMESYTVLLAMDSTKKRPTITVVVQHDDKLNQTVLMFWREGGWR